MDIDEIPSPIDLRDMRDAREWESKAMDRPYREEFFAALTAELGKLSPAAPDILELGSGPGFLAAYILDLLPTVSLQLLDFSAAMHELARNRIAPWKNRVTFTVRDFRKVDWSEDLGTYDAIITVQAVHELRHKRHADNFHRQVKSLLRPGGKYLVCDHFYGKDGMNNEQLYMTLDEQRNSLARAGFNVTDILIKGGRSLFLAT